MNKFSLFIVAIPFLLTFAACGDGFSSTEIQEKRDIVGTLDRVDKIKSTKLTIADVDDLMDNEVKEKPAVDFSSPIEVIDDKELAQTPTGSSLKDLAPGDNTFEDKVSIATKKVVATIAQSLTCERACSPEVKDTLKSDRETVEKNLSRITTEVVKNELRNRVNFTGYLNGFANEFRLYQDVLRVVKSFEYLTKLTNTYPLRDFAFTNKNVWLTNFLKNWWAEYSKHVKEQNLTPFPVEGRIAKGQSVGLTVFPDSIIYAKQHLLSTNMSFFGNNLSLLNNSIYYLITSSAATKTDIDWLFESLLAPYMMGEDGKINQERFNSAMTALKSVYEHHLANSGGQLAQIFVKDDVAPLISYMAWNGGEPIWLSKKTGRAIFAVKNGKEQFMPPNVFWPETADEKEDYVLPKINSLVNDFVFAPAKLASIFPVNKPSILAAAADFIGDTPTSKKTAEFVTRDVMQARLLPHPMFFTDESTTGVEFFTFNEVSPESIAQYEKDVFDIVRGVFSDFLANVKSESEFKEGNFLLKSAFQRVNQKAAGN